MKKDLIKVYKRLSDGSEVELLADFSQLKALSKHPDFKIPELKEKSIPGSPKNKSQTEEGGEGV